MVVSVCLIWLDRVIFLKSSVGSVSLILSVYYYPTQLPTSLQLQWVFLIQSQSVQRNISLVFLLFCDSPNSVGILIPVGILYNFCFFPLEISRCDNTPRRFLHFIGKRRRFIVGDVFSFRCYKSDRTVLKKTPPFGFYRRDSACRITITHVQKKLLPMKSEL